MTDQTQTGLICVDDARAIPWPNVKSHKHSRGRLAVVAGSPLHTGAARLAAGAGQRIGAGWVNLYGTPDACEIMAHHETSILISVRDCRISLRDQIEDFEAIVIGPAFGLTPSCCADVLELAAHFQGGLVLDADALTLIAGSGEKGLKILRARPEAAILTPHSGEFARLFGEFDAGCKVAATQAAARLSGTIIVHKGAITVLAAPNGDVFLCEHATPFLASAGSGDVLAGLIGGLLAQGMAAIDACKAAIWIHGEAGRRVGAGLIAQDLISILPNVLNDLAPHALKRTIHQDLASSR